MSLRFTLRSNGEIAVREVDAMARRVRDLRPALEDMGEHMVNNSVPATFRAGGRPSAWARSAWTAQKVQQDSGRLLRSVDYRASQGKLEVGTNLTYAGIRQFGGTIKPVRAKFLAVPVPDLPRTMRRPKRWGDRLRLVMNKSKKPIALGVRAGNKGARRTRIVFWLKKEVTQPARPFIVFQDADLLYFGRSIGRFIAEGG